MINVYTKSLFFEDKERTVLVTDVKVGDKTYGMSVSYDCSSEELDVGINALVDSVMKKELGFTKTDIIIALAKAASKV